MRRRQSPPRRGVLMLVILALLAMFAMVAVAFVVLTGMERRTAKEGQRIGFADDPPEKTLNQALGIVLIGPSAQVGPNAPQPTAGLTSQNLLEKLYGHESYPMPQSGLDGAPLTSVTPLCGGQLLEFAVQLVPNNPAPGFAINPLPPDIVADPAQPYNADLSRRIGCVITVVGPPTSEVYGLSTRIVSVSPSTGQPQMLAFENGKMPKAGDLVLINGLTFGGMGFGYDPTTALVWLRDTNFGNREVSMMPRHRWNWDWTAKNASGVTVGLAGGANCDYTCPDFQDLLLGWQVPTILGDGSSALPIRTPIPSLHRSELVQYWATREAGGDWKNLDPALLRLIMFRPVGMGMPNADHPNFNGSNPSVTPTTPWDPLYAPLPQTPGVNGQMLDVDNDGDGEMDSVWVDLGMPVRWTADGRAYKPLFAILCLDMDGRLNLNAHGSLAQLSPQHPAGGNAMSTAETVLTTGAAPQLAPGGGTLPICRGQGLGPAEINLLPLLQDPVRCQRIMQGSTAMGLTGRYGESAGGAAWPGTSGTFTRHTYNKLLDYNGNYWLSPADPTWRLGAYGTPPDMQSFGNLAFDPAGRPLFVGRLTLGGQAVVSMGGTISNTPYDLDLMRNAPHLADYAPVDNPFGPAEIERLLRPFDRDTITLPDRLASLISGDRLSPGLPAAEQWKRCLLTTESWSVNTTSAVIGYPYRIALAGKKDGYGNPDRPRHFADFLRARNIPKSLWYQLLAPEMFAGLRFNLVRPIVAQWDQGRSTWVNLHAPYLRQNDQGTDVYQFDPAGWNDGAKGPANPMQSRMLMARYLYCLLTLLRDPWDVQLFSGGGDVLPVSESQPSGLRGDPNRNDSGPCFEFAQRRLAQFSINAVAFCTPDSIMLPFKYKIDPFLAANPGWCKNNNLTDMENGTCGLVWSCKPPELLLTESVAWHNRGVADTAGDPSGKKRTDKKSVDGKEVPADDDLDQVRVPQGPLFVELFCPRSAINGVAPPDLYGYDAQNKKWYLDLARATPAGPSTPAASVWRIVVTESTRKDAAAAKANDIVMRLAGQTRNGPATGLRGYYWEGDAYNFLGGSNDPRRWTYGPDSRPNSCSLEPDQFVTMPSGVIDPVTGNPAVNPPGRFSMKRIPDATEAVNVKIERVISLAPVKPQGPAAQVTYYNRNGAKALYGGQYALLGPRAVTSVGSKDKRKNAGKLGVPSDQQITIAAGGSSVKSLASTTTPYSATGQIRPVLGMVCAADQPSDWSSHPQGVGMSISEPLPIPGTYYPEPTIAGPDGNKDWYGDPNQPDTPGTTDGFKSHPFEGDATKHEVWPNAPIVKDKIWKTGTYSNYKTLFLQRIADPTSPYDPVNNPYITVDWLPVDLTVFNGEDKQGTAAEDAVAGGQPWDPDDPGTDLYKSPNVIFSARQRGQQASRTDTYPNYYYFNIWAPLSEQWPRYAAAQVGDNIFSADLRHTLGFINEAFWNDGRTAPYTSFANQWTTAEPYVGDPAKPYPWITWNARPYVSELELIQVPATSPARLLWEFQTVCPEWLPASPYYPTPNEFPSFPHLLNFFSSTRGDPARRPDTPSPQGSMLLRAFDFMGVPSRFVRTDTLINPAAAAGAPGAHWFHPPFNRISTYREPGRVNMNTIATREVLQGLLNYCPGSGDQQYMPTTWMKFLRSRHGIRTTDPETADIDAGVMANSLFPTRFGRHYRSATGIELQPVITAGSGGSLASSYCNYTGGWNGPTSPRDPFLGLFQPHHEDDLTIVRHGSIGDRAVAESLFHLDPAAYRQTPPACYDWNRNSYCREQSMQRLANLTTCRSNVFAVWITVGNFEVTPWTNRMPGGQQVFDAGHPDGWQLGQELGSDTGEMERHRAFYLIDRSIPVGFQRGKDVNSEKAVLIRHFIE